MVRSTAAAVLGLVLVVALASPGQGLTRSFRDAPGGPTGPHNIDRVVVDNTGPRVAVTVWHQGPHWEGRVVLHLDTSGRAGAEHTVTIRHARDPRPTFRNANGTPWKCADLTARSRPTDRYTVLAFPRRCAVGGATAFSVRVAAEPVRGRTDRHSTPEVAQFAPAPATAQKRPNVLLFVVDDMRADDLGAMPLTRRWLQSGGTTWSNSLAPNPLCCPARASILTGQYSHNHGVYTHKEPYGFKSFDDRSTLATWLNDAGYHTTMLGKYLNGYGVQPPPGQTSGDSRFYYPPGWDDWRGSVDGNGTYRYWDTTLSLNRGRGLQSLVGEYQTYAYGGITSQMVAANAPSATPFFSMVNFTAPHAGLPREGDDPGTVTRDDGQSIRIMTPAVPPDLRDSFHDLLRAAPGADWHDPDRSDLPPEFRRLPEPNAAELAGMREAHRQRWQALAGVDTAIDQVMRTLQQVGELRNTYVVFTSDNGYFLGEHGIRQGKTIPYDAALRTPLLIRGPGIPAGEVRRDPFLSTDFAPTILEMAGLPMPASVDGTGQLAVARSGDRGWTRPVLVNTGPRSTVRQTDESGTSLLTEDPGAADRRYILGVRTSRYLYTDHADGFEELYDLSIDPNAYENLVINDDDGDPSTPNRAEPGNAALLDHMRAELARLRACDGEACRVALTPPPPNP